MNKKPLRIGEVASQTGVSVATLRYYERRGLIAAPARSASGYRAYPQDVLDEVRLIRRMQRLGFTLEEILALLATRRDPHGTCADVLRYASHKVGDLDRQIEELSRSRDQLAALLESCPERTDLPARQCPILVGLDKRQQEPPG